MHKIKKNSVRELIWWGLKHYIRDTVKDFEVCESELQPWKHYPVQTYTGPKLLQESVFLLWVRRRQNLHSVVTSQLDAHQAKRLRKREEMGLNKMHLLY